ncbi:MAG: hypothetical protein ABJE66_01035 [Deltaproteobacteria bacterium]
MTGCTTSSARARVPFERCGWGLPSSSQGSCSHPTTTLDGCQSSVTGLYAGIGAEHRYVAYGSGVVLVIGGIAAAIIAAGLGAVH